MTVQAFASGTQTATIGTEHTLSQVNVAGRFQFIVDLTNMAAGDVLELRVKQIVLTGGAVHVAETMLYQDAQPADAAVVFSSPIANELTDTGAVTVTLKQTFGTGRAYPWKVMNLEVFPANFPSMAIDASGRVDISKWLGTLVTAATAGIPDVNAKNIANVAAALDAANLLKVDTEDWKGGVIPAPGTTGVPIVDVQRILNTLLTESVAGRLAAGFKELLDVATPVFNLASINQTGDSFARLGAPSGASIDADILNVKNQVWDEVLTGAAHNVPSSAGRRLRTLSNVVVFDGLVQSATSHTIVFQAGPSATSDVYNGNLVILTTGAGAGQSRKIVDWVGGTLTAYLDKPLVTLPSLGDGVQIQAADSVQLAAMGAVQGVPTSTTVQLESIASAVDNIYNGQTIVIFDQTNNNVEARIISAYNGTTKVATVSPAMVHTPSAGDAYTIHIRGRAMVDVQNVAGPDSAGVTTLLSRLTQAILFDASGNVKSDVEDWRASLVNALISGRVDSNAQVVGDKTGYALTAGEHTLIQSDDQAAMTAQGYTTARAGFLDTLNGLVAAIWNALTSGMATAGSIGLLLKTDVDATISSRATPGAQMDLVNAPNATALTAIAAAIWNALTSGMVTAGSIGNLLSQFRFTVANQVDANALTGGGGATPAQIWDYLTANITTAGSIGLLLKTNVDAVLSTISGKLGGFTGITTSNVFNWLQAMMRSDVATPPDIGGTYTSLADALQAIAAGGGGGGSTATQIWNFLTTGIVTTGSIGKFVLGLTSGGGGSLLCTFTVTVAGLPKDGVDTWITTDAAGLNIIARATTNDVGQVQFLLDPGSYYWWKQLAGFTWTPNPEPITVS